MFPEDVYHRYSTERYLDLTFYNSYGLSTTHQKVRVRSDIKQQDHHYGNQSLVLSSYLIEVFEVSHIDVHAHVSKIDHPIIG